MAEEKKYDLSITGDLKSKIVAILLAMTCFATVFQAAMNGIHSWMEISYKSAYRIFVSIYFLLPGGFLLYLLIYKNIRLFHYWICQLIFVFFITGGASILFNVSNIYFLSAYSLIGLVIAFLCVYGINKGFSFFLLLLVGISLIPKFLFSSLLILVLVFVTVPLIGKLVPENSVADQLISRLEENLKSRVTREYLITVSLFIVVTVSILRASKVSLDPDNEADPYSKTDVFTGYGNRDKISNRLITRFDTLYKMHKASLGKIKFLIQSHPGNRYSKKDHSSIAASGIDSLMILYKRWIKNFDGDWREEMFNKKTADILFAKIDTSFLDIKNYGTRIENKVLAIAESNSIADTAALFSYRLKLRYYYSLLNNLNENASLNKDKYDTYFKEKWLYQTSLLQFKGLVWFFVSMIVLFTLIYKKAKEIEGIEKEYHSSGWRDARVLTIGRTGEAVKNLLYLVILLTLPYFKHITEQDINVEKPFLNFDATDLSGGFFEPLSKEGIEDGGGTESIREGDIAFIENDSSTVYTGDVINFYQINMPADSAVIGAVDSGLFRAIRFLGKKSITSPADRKVFLESFEKEINKK